MSACKVRLTDSIFPALLLNKVVAKPANLPTPTETLSNFPLNYWLYILPMSSLPKEMCCTLLGVVVMFMA